jgi:hypothetical protein
MFMKLAGMFGLTLILSSAVVSADEMPSSADTESMRNVINRQLDAFARGDATTAFAQASPIIQAKFQNEEKFMAMVRQGYAALIQPDRVDFVDAKETPDGAVFGVRVFARDGSSWIAAYQMVRDESENWRIDGCQLVRASGQQI